MNTPHADFKFSIRLIAWCQENGVDTEIEITKLYELINEFYIPIRPKTFKASSIDYLSLRLAMNLSAREVCVATGIKTSQYSLIERGLAKPSGKTLHALDKFFGIERTI